MQIRSTQSRLSAHALMFDPQFYPFDFSLDRQVTKYLLVDEGHLDMAPFLDVRFEGMAKASFDVSTNDLFSLENSHGIQRQVPNFIFHHAFVCSTLLARSLNEAQYFFSLKEPWILRRLADTKRNPNSRIPRTRWRQMIVNYTNLLARDYAGGSVPVIKMTNVANNLLEDIFRYLPKSSSIYLYSSLKGFLISNLKKDDQTKQKMPQLASWFIGDAGFKSKFPDFCKFENLTFLQICSVVWMANLYNFRIGTQKYQGSRVRTLDMDVFIENPVMSLKALTEFYGYPSSSDDLKNMTAKELMEFNAKDPDQAFNTDNRKSESRAIIDKYEADINKAVAWSQPLIEELGLIEYMRSLRLL